MIDIIKEWTDSKSGIEYNYNEALEILIKNKNIYTYNETLKTLIKKDDEDKEDEEVSIANQPIEDYLHFDFSKEDIEKNFEAIGNINKDYIYVILELINQYSYYLEMNDILKSQDDKNIKKLKQLNKLLDDDFLDFLDRYLDLDKTILSSSESLKIETHHQNVVKHYLQYDFKFAINELYNFLNKHTIQKNSIDIKDENIVNSLLVKPKTKGYLKPIGKRGILKCLYFDLLSNFKDISKEQSIDIIKEFFDIVLEDKKEHTLKAETIKYIKEGNFENTTSKIVKKEITEIFNIKKYIEDNFIPLYTTYDK